MHKSALDSFLHFDKTYLSLLSEPHIVEIGSLDINSSIKNFISQKHTYTGVDITAGKNVDVVLKDPYKFPIDGDSVDVVIAISTFEHIDFFWLTYLEILRILKKGGIFFLNVPSNGNFHRHNNDNWRFYPDSSLALEKWGLKNGFNNSCLEHFTLDHSGRSTWNDYIAIIIKEKNEKDKYPNRIIDKFKNFRNGRDDKSEKIFNFNKISHDQDNWGWKIFYKFRKFLNKINNKY